MTGRSVRTADVAPAHSTETDTPDTDCSYDSPPSSPDNSSCTTATVQDNNNTRLTALSVWHYPVSRWLEDKISLKLLKQETVSDSDISWTVYKSAPHSRQITTTASHQHSVLYTGRMSFMPHNQQCSYTEGVFGSGLQHDAIIQ